MAHDDDMEGKRDEAKGTVKEKAGEVRDDDRQRAEGKMDQVTGQAKQGMVDGKDTAQEAGNRVNENVNR